MVGLRSIARVLNFVMCPAPAHRHASETFRVSLQLGRREKYLDSVVHLDCPLYHNMRAPGPPGPEDEPTDPPLNSKEEASLQTFREDFRKMVSKILPLLGTHENATSEGAVILTRLAGQSCPRARTRILTDTPFILVPNRYLA